MESFSWETLFEYFATKSACSFLSSSSAASLPTISLLSLLTSLRKLHNSEVFILLQ
jgi:hypothetical protein